MLRPCQHKLAFSKVNWYTSALKAVLPSSNGKKLLSSALWKAQSRRTATMASVLVDSSIMPTTTTFVISPPQPEPLVQPLRQQAIIYPKAFKRKKRASAETFRRCNGFRRYDGQRCERMVRIDPTLPEVHHVVCFDHDPTKVRRSKKQKHKTKTCSHVHDQDLTTILDTTSPYNQHHTDSIIHTYKTPPKVFDCWHLWIDNNIKKSKRDLIRQEMEKPVSRSDQPGFIYVYSLSQGPRVSRNTYAYFKVGRTTNPHRRMYQVSNVCKLDPKIIELFPSFPLGEKQQILPTNLETLENTLDQVPKCPLSHRVERLIHLELSSLHKMAGYKCPECGSIHREWIRVIRRKHRDGRPMTDQELWLSCVRPVILKWVQYGVVASALKG